MSEDVPATKRDLDSALKRLEADLMERRRQMRRQKWLMATLVVGLYLLSLIGILRHFLKQ